MIVLGKVPREAFLLKKIKSNFPNVLDLSLTEGGLGRYHLIIQMRQKQYGKAKNLISYAFGCRYDIKQVIVVDEGINIHIQHRLNGRYHSFSSRSRGILGFLLALR